MKHSFLVKKTISVDIMQAQCALKQVQKVHTILSWNGPSLRLTQAPSKNLVTQMHFDTGPHQTP
jgi:hypothetical protein